MAFDIVSFAMGKAAGGGGGGGGSLYRVCTPLHTDFDGGYVSSTKWIYSPGSTSRTDIYKLEAGHAYLVHLGATFGNRFRVAYYYTDPFLAEEDISGTANILVSDTPVAYMVAAYGQRMVKFSQEVYLAVTKTNQSVDGLIAYVTEFAE